jgi:uncharacterized membrane protein
VARPTRNLWRIRTVVRRRHRTWMLSMTLATIGWAGWWYTAFTYKLVPWLSPHPRFAAWFGGALALLGLLAAAWSIRARRAWLLLTVVPLFANLTLLFFPLVLKSLGAMQHPAGR